VLNNIDYILLVIELVACIVTIIRITYFRDSFIDPDADDEIYDRRTVSQMYGEWEDENTKGKIE